MDKLPKLTCTPPDLNNGEYVKEADVPVFHDGTDNRDDQSSLQTIVTNTNARTKTCDYPVITLGHSIEGAPETEQPPVIGFGTNFRLVDFADRPTIIADLYIQKAQRDKVKSFPRRSAEIWREGMYIDPIALLGYSTPARDLSLTYSKKGEKYCACEKEKFCMEGEPAPGPCPNKNPTPAKPEGRIARMQGMLKKLPSAAKEKGKQFVINKYKKLSERYGKKGAAVVLGAMVLLTPIPIPGSSLLPIALAEGIKFVNSKLHYEKDVLHGDLVEAVKTSMKEWYSQIGQKMPKLTDEQIEKVVQKMIDNPEKNCKEGAPKPGPCKGTQRKSATISTPTSNGSASRMRPNATVTKKRIAEARRENKTESKSQPKSPKQERVAGGSMKALSIPKAHYNPKQHRGKNIAEKNAMGEDTYDMDSQQIVDEVLKALESSDVFAWVKSKMAEEGDQGEPEAAADEFAQSSHDANDDLDHAGIVQHSKKDEKEEDELEPMISKEEDKEEFSQTKRKLERYQKAYATLENRVNGMERTTRVAQRKADLLDLEHQGYDFSMKEELETVADLPKENYNRHLKRIKERYKKAPLPNGIHAAYSPPLASTGDSYQEGMQAAELVLSKKAKDVSEALRIIRGGN